MFRFKSLNTIVRDLAEKIDAARNAPTTTEKVEQLLAASEENHDRMLKLERKRGDIGMASFLGTFAGIGVTMWGLMAAPVLGVAALLASPIFLAGAALTAVAATTCFVTGMSMDPLRHDRDVIEKQINRDVADLVKADAKEAEKSPRYRRSLTCIFRAAAEGDKSYETLVNKIAPKKAPAVTGTAP